jgi:3',5'-cyclic AMP phosphodiesterase CpdA
MPVTLPPLSRREFLQRTAVAAAAMGLAPGAYAGLFGKSADPHTFAFFSDPHIAADVTLRHGGVNMADNFAACIRELAAWPKTPAAILVNGDLAYKFGLPDDYAAFGKLIAPLRALAPLHLTLGNHDQREHFWSAFPAAAARLKSVPQKQVAVFSSARANWFVLDSLDLTNHTPGELGVAQLAWLSRELAARPARPAVVVVHHSPDVTGQFGLKDTPALEEIFIRHRQAKAMIFGHTHTWNISQQDNGVYLINLPPTGYVFQEGRPSGWVRVTLARDGMDVELRSLDPKQPDHGKVKQLRWRA